MADPTITHDQISALLRQIGGLRCTILVPPAAVDLVTAVVQEWDVMGLTTVLPSALVPSDQLYIMRHCDG
jgi:hypothetical protein